MLLIVNCLHPTRDLAKSALRDMGVEVTLEERWHGKGHEIEMGD